MLLKMLYNILRDERGTTLAVTYAFSANTLVVASQMNANFNDVEAVVNALTADNMADDAITAAKLNSDVVRSGYGLLQHADGTLYIDVSDTNPCLELTDGGVRVKVDDSSIERAAGGLQVKALGITNAMLAGSIADAKLVETYLNVTRHDADDHSSFNFATMGINSLPKDKGGTGITQSLIKAARYTGNATNPQNVAHSLGAIPSIVLIMPETPGLETAILYMYDGTVENCIALDGSATAVAITCDATNIKIASTTYANTNGRAYGFVAFSRN